MAENSMQKCLFIGGTADGRRLGVNAGKQEQRIPSFSEVPLPDEEPAHEEGEPVLEESMVVEVYRRMEVEHDGEVVVVFVLNGLSEEAIQAQMVKHFGEEKALPLV